MNLREGLGRGLLAAWTLGVCAFGHAQNETSASLSGEVTESAGGPIANAEVALSHRTTGSETHALTNGEGRFVFTGLRIDGSHTLKVTAPGFRTQTSAAFELGPGEQRTMDIALTRSSEPAFVLDTLTVTAVRTGSTGVTDLSQTELEEFPSIERSLNEYARTDSRVTLVDAERGELAAAGQNSRYNSVQIDGIRLNDQFGVTPNGLPSQGNPFSMETVEAIGIDLAPYNVNRSGFTGASINAVTRSGTNDFRGSIFYTYRDQNYRAKNPGTGRREIFSDTTASVTLGGPVLRNRLFFFAAYETSRRIEPAPAAGFEPTAAAIDRIVAAASAYTYSPGALENPGQQNKQDRKYLAKLDWHINECHRLSIRYSETRGHQPVFADYSTPDRISLSGHWYDSEQNLAAWSAQIFSRWNDEFQSEVKVAGNRYVATRSPRSRFPQVRINGVPGTDGGTGSVFIGTEDASQVNDLNSDNSQMHATATWLIGNHRVMSGFDVEHSGFRNAFVQNAWGAYSFASIDSFAAGNPSVFTFQYPLPGQNGAVAWGYTIDSLFVQDTWQVLPELSVTAGLRLDYAAVNQKPEYNPLVDQTFGYRNDSTVDGARVFAPRLSVSYRPKAVRRLNLHGGTGVFQGRAPGVWMSNAYSNDGISTAVNTTIGRFSADPAAQPKGNPATQRQRVDLMDAGFHLPTVLRSNIAADYRLRWQDLTFEAEIMNTRTLHALAYKNLNLRRTGTGPDGRAIYGDRTSSLALASNSQFKSAEFTDVYLLTNTSKGDTTHLSVRVRRPMRSNWSASIAYTRGRAREVSPATSSTAGTNFSTRAGLDPNDDELGTANYEVRDRILATAAFQFALLRNCPTKITLFYEGRSGRPYSFIFGSDVNGDSADQLNDLFYVPNGRDDPRVRWSDPDQADAFFDYLASNGALQRFAGKVTPRNSERSEFQHQLDLKVSQSFPLWQRLRGEIFCDIANLGNLLNSRWGRSHQVNFPYGLIVANASYDPKAGQYVFRYTSARTPTLQASTSRWQIQTGLRVKF